MKTQNPEIEFSVKKYANRKLKDSLLLSGARLVGSGKACYQLSTTDYSLIPNDSRVRVNREHWECRLQNFSEQTVLVNPEIINKPNGDLRFIYPNKPIHAFVSGKQFKSYYKQ